MAQFSEADINEAKRRVMDMRNRANRYTDHSPSPPHTSYQNAKNSSNQSEHTNPDGRSNSNNFSQDKKEEQNTKNQNPLGDLANLLSGDGNSDNSFVIILALIMILSREGADNKLILALLYLLL